KSGYETGRLERPVRYGPEFVKPDKSVLRRHKAKQPAKMFEAEEVRALLDGKAVVGNAGPERIRPDATLRAMILLSSSPGLTVLAAGPCPARGCPGGASGAAAVPPPWPDNPALDPSVSRPPA